MEEDKVAIFQAWYDYDHAVDEDAKGQAKVRRNGLIREIIERRGAASDVRAVLDFLFPEYRQWLVSEGYRVGGRRF